MGYKSGGEGEMKNSYIFKYNDLQINFLVNHILNICNIMKILVSWTSVAKEAPRELFGMTIQNCHSSSIYYLLFMDEGYLVYEYHLEPPDSNMYTLV